MLFKINIIFISAIFFSFPFPLQADPFCGMTCKDILQMEKPTMVSLSADGTKILFVIETSSLEKNNVQQTLYLWKKSSSQQLLQWEKIEQILRGKENTWYILGKDEEEYKIISLEKDKLALLLSSKNPIPLFTVTQNGSDLYYTQILSTSQETLKNQQEEGYVYRWGSDSSSVTTGKSYAHQEWEEVRRVDLSSHQDTLVTRFSHQGWTDLYPLISDLQVSKEGGYLSLIIESFGDTNQGQTPFRSSLLVYDLQNQTSCRLF